MISGILLSIGFDCPNCRQSYSLPFHEKYSTKYARGRVESLINKYGEIAFWGLGIEMQLLLKKMDIFSLANIFIIDKDIQKQGLQFMNHTVNAPDILKFEKLGAVIPTPVSGLSYNRTIENEVAEYCEAKVISIGEFLKLDQY
ncbi:MAG: hypothetical protein WCJ01_06045 [Ignavibacteria bacterium]